MLDARERLERERWSRRLGPSGLPTDDILNWREQGILGRRDSVYKSAFTVEVSIGSVDLDGMEGEDGGQVEKVRYIYSVICLLTTSVAPILGPVLRA